MLRGRTGRRKGKTSRKTTKMRQWRRSCGEARASRPRHQVQLVAPAVTGTGLGEGAKVLPPSSRSIPSTMAAEQQPVWAWTTPERRPVPPRPAGCTRGSGSEAHLVRLALQARHEFLRHPVRTVPAAIQPRLHVFGYPRQIAGVSSSTPAKDTAPRACEEGRAPVTESRTSTAMARLANGAHRISFSAQPSIGRRAIDSRSAER